MNHNSFVYDLSKKKENVAHKYFFPIIIDRYKMPGLNPEGTAFSEDLCYGYGNSPQLPIFDKSSVEKYIKDALLILIVCKEKVRPFIRKTECIQHIGGVYQLEVI